MDKLERATDLKLVGDNSFRRGYIQRGTIKDGDLDPETYRSLKLTALMIKLGCHRLNHTHCVENGGMSSRQARRHLSSGILPAFKIRLSTSLDDQGKLTIKKNMEFANGRFTAIYDSRQKILC